MTFRTFACALLLLAVPGWAAADEALWSLLKGGGQVVLIRHAVTTPGVGDPGGMKLDDCATQRNLSDEGRADARALGEAWRRRGIEAGMLLSSPWCRCLETARLAFQREAKPEPALGNVFGRREIEAKQTEALKKLLVKPQRGNTVMLSHGSTIFALTGVSPGTGEAVIVTPQAGGAFKVAGRLRH
jgi:phosphohistidine phosphatase SixA